MLINQKPTSQTNNIELFTDGVIYINSAQWLLAYGIFKELIANAKNPSGALLYNMALCQFFAEEYGKVVSTLSEALQKTAKPSSLSIQASNSPEPLIIQEYQNSNYLFALTETVFSVNPAIVKLRIRRLLVDANLLLENWQEVVRLSALPEMNKCKNVMDSLAEAKNNFNI